MSGQFNEITSTTRPYEDEDQLSTSIVIDGVIQYRTISSTTLPCKIKNLVHIFPSILHIFHSHYTIDIAVGISYDSDSTVSEF